MEKRITNPLFFPYYRTPKITEFKKDFEFYVLQSPCFIPDYTKITNHYCSILKEGHTQFTQCSIKKYYINKQGYACADLIEFDQNKFGELSIDHRKPLIKGVSTNCLFKFYKEIGRLVPFWNSGGVDELKEFKWKPVHPKKYSCAIRKYNYGEKDNYYFNKIRISKGLEEGLIKTLKIDNSKTGKSKTLYDNKKRPVAIIKIKDLPKVFQAAKSKQYAWDDNNKLYSNLNKHEHYLLSLVPEKKVSGLFWKSLKKDIDYIKKETIVSKTNNNSLRKAWLNNKILVFIFNKSIIEIKPPMINDVGGYDISKSIYINGKTLEQCVPGTPEHNAWIKEGPNDKFRAYLYLLLDVKTDITKNTLLEEELTKHFLYSRNPKITETKFYTIKYYDPDNDKKIKTQVIREFNKERAKLTVSFMTGCFPLNITDIKEYGTKKNK